MCNLLCPDIVRADRKCGYTLYGLLVAGFAAVTAVVIYSSVQRRASPPTQIELSKKTFPWPHLTMCADPTEASASFLTDEMGLDASPDGEEEVQFEYEVLGAQPFCNASDPGEFCYTAGSCITFFTGAHEARNKEAYLAIYLPFNPTYRPLEADRAHLGRSNVLEVHMHRTDNFWEADLDLKTTFAAYPAVLQMVVEPTLRVKLDGTRTYDYSTTQTVAPLTSYSGNATLGEAVVMLYASPNGGQVTTVTETDPLDPVVLVGVISGLWGIVAGAFAMVFRPVEREQLMGMWRSKPPGVADSYAYGDKDVEMAALAAGKGAHPSSGAASPR